MLNLKKESQWSGWGYSADGDVWDHCTCCAWCWSTCLNSTGSFLNSHTFMADVCWKGIYVLHKLYTFCINYINIIYKDINDIFIFVCNMQWYSILIIISSMNNIQIWIHKSDPKHIFALLLLWNDICDSFIVILMYKEDHAVNLSCFQSGRVINESTLWISECYWQDVPPLLYPSPQYCTQ